MDAFRQWALCLIISAAAGTFVCALSPRGAVEKAVRTVVGIFVVTVICAPLTQLQKSDFSIPVFGDSYIESDSEEALKDQMLESCKSEIENRLAELADKHSIELSKVKIDAYIDEYNSIIIQNIHLETDAESSETVTAFQTEATESLGVPVTVRNGTQM